MFKLKRVILFMFCLAVLFSQGVNAAESEWKEPLRYFLADNFPHLFNEEAKIKNDALFFTQSYEDLLSTPLSEFSADIIKDGSFIVPVRYNFYDLDFDGIPEAIIDYGALDSGVGFRYVAKLYGASYEIIGTLTGGEYYESLYINPDNKIVSVKRDRTQVFEIKNKEIVYSEYIDSTGSDSLDGVKYGEIGNYSHYFSFPTREAWLATEVFLADLRRFPEFDCSDVVEAAKRSDYAPKTGDNCLIAWAVLIAACFAGIKNFKNKRAI